MSDSNTPAMPGSWKLVGFVGIRDVARAREFYAAKLGLQLIEERDGE